MKTTPEQRAYALHQSDLTWCPVIGKRFKLSDIIADIESLTDENAELRAEVDRLKRLRRVTAEWANNTQPPTGPTTFSG